MAIRWKLLILLVCVALLPLLLAAAISVRGMLRAGQRTATDTASLLAEEGRQDLEHSVGHAATLMMTHSAMVDLVVDRYRAALDKSFGSTAGESVAPRLPILRARDFGRGGTLPVETVSDPRYSHPSAGPNPVSFQDWSFLLPDGVAPGSVAESIARVQRTLPTVRQLANPTARTRHLVSRFFCGFESGLHASYPGQGNYPEEYDPRLRPWYKAAMSAGTTFNTPPYVDASSRRAVISSVWPLRSPAGTPIGVAGVDLDHEEVFGSIELPAVWGRATQVFIVKLPPKRGAPELSVVLESKYAESEEEKLSLTEWGIKPRKLAADDPAPFAAFVDSMRSRHSGVASLQHLGVPTWWGFSSLRGLEFRLLFVVPEAAMTGRAIAVGERIEQETDDQVLLFGLAFVLVAGLVALLAIVSSRAFTRPIRRLADSVHTVADGNLETRVPIQTRDEIGQLSTDFNTMVRQIQAHIKALKAETAAREQVEAELRIGREIQASMLPACKPPFSDHEAFDLAALNQPSKFVAGDFYDFFWTEDGRLGLVMADVSGKGVPAALFMAVSKTVLHAEAERGDPPGVVFGHANSSLYASKADRSMFVTVFLGLYSPDTGVMEYANAGHCVPRIVRPGGGVREVAPATGTILGAFEDQEWESATLSLERGESLVLYTDGVTEARTEEGNLRGEEGLDAFLAAEISGGSGTDSRGLAERVLSLGNDAADDDVTVLILRRN